MIQPLRLLFARHRSPVGRSTALQLQTLRKHQGHPGACRVSPECHHWETCLSVPFHKKPSSGTELVCVEAPDGLAEEGGEVDTHGLCLPVQMRRDREEPDEVRSSVRCAPERQHQLPRVKVKDGVTQEIAQFSLPPH